MAKKKWMDENGVEIPSDRVTKSEKLKERHLNAILKKAQALNEKLVEFKKDVFQKTDEIYSEIINENQIDVENHKGNITHFNFDRSIKLEINLSGSAKFDDLLITAVKDKLMSFIKDSVTTKNKFVETIILDAFQTRSGKLDTRRIMGLLKYKSKVDSPIYDEAMDLLLKAISTPDKKTYIRIYIRNSQGEYENIDLNYSSIQV